MNDLENLTYSERHAMADRIENEFRAMAWAIAPRRPRPLIVSITEVP